MKKLIFLSAFILALVSCSAPVQPVVAPKVDTVVTVVPAMVTPVAVDTTKKAVEKAVAVKAVEKVVAVKASTGTTGAVKK